MCKCLFGTIQRCTFQGINTHACIPFEYLLSWWEFCDKHLNRTIKAKRKWALHFVFACICVYDLNIMSTSQDYSAETGKNMKILLPKWLLLTNISKFQMEWKWQFFFTRSLSFSLVHVQLEIGRFSFHLIVHDAYSQQRTKGAHCFVIKMHSSFMAIWFYWDIIIWKCLSLANIRIKARMRCISYSLWLVLSQHSLQ